MPWASAPTGTIHEGPIEAPGMDRGAVESSNTSLEGAATAAAPSAPESAVQSPVASVPTWGTPPPAEAVPGPVAQAPTTPTSDPTPTTPAADATADPSTAETVAGGDLAPAKPVKSDREAAAAAAADAEWAALVKDLGKAPAGGAAPNAVAGTTHGAAQPTPADAPVRVSPSPMGPIAAVPSTPSEPTASASRATQLAPDEVLVPPPSAQGGARTAQAKDLAGVWNGDTVPFEAIGNLTKLLTPNVGRVRVMLKSREIFEGRLYAMGEGCVWLDTQYGRMGLDGARVDKVERLAAPDGTPELGQKGSQSLAGLEQVRIKTPGGIFVGKVVSKDVQKTTLVTEDGSKVTFDTKDVEYLGEGPKTVIKK
jgi:hypothetical protein